MTTSASSLLTPATLLLTIEPAPLFPLSFTLPLATPTASVPLSSPVTCMAPSVWSLLSPATSLLSVTPALLSLISSTLASSTPSSPPVTASVPPPPLPIFAAPLLDMSSLALNWSEMQKRKRNFKKSMAANIINIIIMSKNFFRACSWHLLIKAIFFFFYMYRSDWKQFRLLHPQYYFSQMPQAISYL